MEPKIHEVQDGVVKELPAGPVGKKFTNQKFHKMSFANRDLSHADFRGSSVVGCDFTNSDLSYANFEGCNCWEANFTDARLYKTNFKDSILARSIMKPKDCFGMTITLSCDTVDKMVIGEKWETTWIFMALMMELPDKKMETALINTIGPERYLRLRQIFDNRMI